MTKHMLEQQIKTAVEHSAPDQLDHILSSCTSQSNLTNASVCPEHSEARKKGAIISMEEMSKKKQRMSRLASHPYVKQKTGLAAIAAAAILVLCVGGFSLLRQSPAPQFDSVIMLDVNPSLSMHVDADETVLSVEPLNDDAREVLGNMDLKNTSLEVAVNAIIGSMLQKNYLTDIQNSILVSVENQDAARGEQLQEKVSQLITSAIQTNSLEVAVLSQNVSADDASLAKLAEKYEISLGKAALILEVITQAPTLTFEDLAPMTINEIALLAAAKNVSSESVTQSGTASDKAYISQDEALRLACAHAGVTPDDIIKMNSELDSDHGVMIYEIEFETAAKKGDYEINAITGQIIQSEWKDAEGSLDASGYIGTAAAKEIALNHAGIAAEDILEMDVKLDSKDHVMIYEVEFESAAKKGEYEINASTGQILNYEIKDKSSNTTVSKSDESKNENSNTSGDANTNTDNENHQADGDYIGESAAKSAALNDADISEDNTFFMTWYYGYHNGKRSCYYVKFGAGDTVYLYQIDLYTGTVLDKETYPSHYHGSGDDHNHGHEHDHGDSSGSTENTSASDSTSYIGESAALSAVLNAAGVSESSLSDQKVKLDDRGNTMVYEIEFKSGRTEYQYLVDALNGDILKSQIDTHE